MADLILAHDIGTSGNKATLYTSSGKLITSATQRYDTRYFTGNCVEQNPDDWWEAVVRATRAVLDGVDAGRVGAVSFSGQMMGCVCVDREGRPVRDAIIWADGRSWEQVRHLLAGLSLEEGYSITGHRISVPYSLPKLLWVRDHEPENFASTWKVLNPKDFIVHRLTGEWVTDESDASGTNLYDLANHHWSERLLDIAAIPTDMLPRIVRSTEVAGTVTRAAAEATGLPRGTPVVCGAGDGVCASVGAGCVTPGCVYTSLGTSAWIATADRSPMIESEMRVFTFAHAVPGLFMPCGTAQSIGSSFNWAEEAIFRAATAPNNQRSGGGAAGVHGQMNALLATVPPGSDGLIFLPYLLGERTPWWNPDARGAFVGLTMKHSKAHLLRAVVEGTFLTMRLILDIFRPHITADVMGLIGGFARGDVQQRILADVYGMPVAVAESLAEATSMGAAIIGGVGAGLLDSFDDADRFTKIARVVEPDPAVHERYSELAEVLAQSYRALEPVFERLSKTCH